MVCEKNHRLLAVCVVLVSSIRHIYSLSVQPDSTRRSIISSPGIAIASSSILSDTTLPSPALASVGSSVILPGSNNVFPLASFGLQVYDDDTAFKLTTIALKAGYRNFFASVLAGNQKGFAKAIKASTIPRSELYICGTVLSNRAKGFDAAYQKTKDGCLENLSIMSKYGDIDQLDMIMLDYPGPDKDSIQGQWKAFQEFQSDSKVTDLAVSNFNAAQLDAIFTIFGLESKAKPCVNQLPFSLANHPSNILEHNLQRGVLVQSWSPLSRVLTNPKNRSVLSSIGNSYGKSAAQIALRWIVQSGSGAGFSTQSQKKSHFEEDLNVFDFELTQKEMELLTQLAT